jgi:hypothetical protein
MTPAALNYINEALTTAGIPYEYNTWNKALTYPYFVGEYTEAEPLYEDGIHEATFTITGTNDGSMLELELAKDKIKKEICNKTAILPNGNGIAVFYAGSSPIPTGNERMKRIQINLTIKELEV